MLCLPEGIQCERRIKEVCFTLFCISHNLNCHPAGSAIKIMQMLKEILNQNIHKHLMISLRAMISNYRVEAKKANICDRIIPINANGIILFTGSVCEGEVIFQ